VKGSLSLVAPLAPERHARYTCRPTAGAKRVKQRIVFQYVVLAALLAILGVTLLYPIWLTVRGGFAENVATGEGFTLRHVLLVFQDPVLREGLYNAFLIAVLTTLLSFAIGLPLALIGARYNFPLKGLWSAAILVPLILPPFVGAIGLRAMLGRSGALNTLFGTDFDVLGEARLAGVVIALALHLYPIVYLNATAALANLDPALDEAADTLGSSAWRRLRTITLPLIRPGLFAGGTVVFIWSFTELGTPLVFDFADVTAVQIFAGVKEMNASQQPYALTAVMLLSAILFYAVGKLAFGRVTTAGSMKAFRAASTARLSPLGALLANLAFAVVTAAALLPHLGVVLEAFAAPGSWYRSIFPERWTFDNMEMALGHPLAFNSIVNSLYLAFAAALLDIGIGLAAAYLIVRTKIRGRSILDALTMLPLAVPGLVMAFGYVAITLQWPFGPGDPLHGVIDVVGADPNPIPLLIIAYAVRRLPYVVRAAVAGLQQVTPELEEASASLGAPGRTTLRRIIVPLIAANLVAGGLLAFAFAMLEVSDSLILAQQERHYPITKAILAFSERLGDGPAIASGMGVWGMALLTTTLVGVSVLLGKRLGSVFRV